MTARELEELTHKVRPSAQVKALRAMGIEHRVRPDGTPLVLRADLPKSGRQNTVKRWEPNWSAVAQAQKN